MQDRSYAIAIGVVLAICCLGVYVAVSGMLNLRSPEPGISAGTAAVPATLVVVVIPTDSPAPPSAGLTLMPTITSPPVPSPLGAFQTITAATTASSPTPQQPTAPIVPAIPPTTAPPTLGTQPCSNFLYCPGGGPPDASLAPTGDQCPRNYIWGRVTDAAGNGIVGVRIRFKGPLGNLDNVETKRLPDPPGVYNILAPAPGGNWVLWVLDSGGGQASPQFAVVAPQAYTGSGNCPTRVDFTAQR